jgi:uncharacterized membrane protein
VAEQPRPNRLQRLVHLSLLAGVAVSGVLLAAGLVVALVSGQPRPEGPAPPVAAVLRSAARGDGVGLLDAGLLLLIATPVLRVAVLAVGWGVEGSWRFAAVAVLVLGLLALGLVLGIR